MSRSDMPVAADVADASVASVAAVGPGSAGGGITAADRLSFTGFLALALHGVIVFGVTFTLPESPSVQPTLDVTLVPYSADAVPERADFLAPFNQAGSGALPEKTLPEQTLPGDTAAIDMAVPEAPSPLSVSPSPPAAEPATRAAAPRSSNVPPQIETSMTVSATTLTTASTTAPASASVATSTATSAQSLLQRSLDMASLEARLAQQQQQYARRPRIKRLTSLATQSSVDAYYLGSWRRKIETIGNLNYPAEARRRRLYGSLRLLVSILPDGALKEVEILESSGHEVLDEAALRIVRLAAPFAPFPDELRAQADVLEIIRTWQFRSNAFGD